MKPTPTLTFLGVGGAFAPLSKGNSNMLVTAWNGKRMLIDCGTSVQYTLKDDFGLTPLDIDALWISHLHADHIGSLEWFAFYRHFVPKKDENGDTIKPKLFMAKSTMDDLWEKSLRGGLGSVEQKVMELSDYFDCIQLTDDADFIWFTWEGFVCTPIKTKHSVGMHSHGLLLENVSNKKVTFITADTQFTPQQFFFIYNKSDQIFHDTETLPNRSGVHSHYDDMKLRLSSEIKSKIWMYHYADKIPSFKQDGFCGFVEKGQEFDL